MSGHPVAKCDGLSGKWHALAGLNQSVNIGASEGYVQRFHRLREARGRLAAYQCHWLGRVGQHKSQCKAGTVGVFARGQPVASL
jgi:hypothetical protein